MSAGVTLLLREGLHQTGGAGAPGCGVISLLLLSPRSHRPGAAEGGSPRTERQGHGDDRGRWQCARSRLQEAGEEVPDPARGAQASALLSLAFLVICETGPVLLIF